MSNPTLCRIDLSILFLLGSVRNLNKVLILIDIVRPR
jgi:hypothetical protein